jgi:aspartyl-tRNA(Asn)/glutamyl-tRNA(Gln) amidotransferase subunit A
MENYNYASIASISKLIKDRTISPVAIIESCLERIEAHNAQFNAFITVLADEARMQAKIAEDEINNGHWKGNLHGIPVAVKDFYDTAGIRTTAGFEYFKNRIPLHDAAVVKKLKEAGAIIIGKTNMHELGMGTTSLVSYFGSVHNPWNAAYIAGGSSGGSAAAVAAGFCYATIDTDAVGSCRLPASCCGVTGFKATYGLISNQGILEGEKADETIIKLSHAGITTRYVEDTAILFHALTDTKQDSFENTVRRIIGFVGNYKANDEIKQIFANTRRILSSLGHTIIDIDIPFESASFNISTIDEDRKNISAKLFSDVDVLVLPTVTEPTPTIKLAETKGPMAVAADNTFFGNYFGLPAISIPCGFDTNDMPVGFQIFGPWNGETVVLEMALAYQQATSWSKMHPQLH